eukprot:13116559-Alexandrium_andersonii.AAC.1
MGQLDHPPRASGDGMRGRPGPAWRPASARAATQASAQSSRSTPPASPTRQRGRRRRWGALLVLVRA